jgi:hypothetical protein
MFDLFNWNDFKSWRSMAVTCLVMALVCILITILVDAWRPELSPAWRDWLSADIIDGAIGFAAAAAVALLAFILFETSARFYMVFAGLCLAYIAKLYFWG